VLRRPIRIVGVALGAFAVLLGAYVWLPAGMAGVRALLPAPAPPGIDTLPLVRLALEQRAALGRLDSLLATARSAPPASTPAAAPGLTAAQRGARDSLALQISGLAGLVQRARNAPLLESYRVLASAPAMRGDTRVRAIVDSLVDIEREREELGGGATVDPVYVALTTHASALGRALVDIGEETIGTLRRELDAIRPAVSAPALAPSVTVPSLDTVAVMAERATTAAAMARTEQRLVAARATKVARDSAVSQQRRTVALAPLPVLIVAAGVVALFLAFAIALADEMRSPRVADAAEAERLSGLRVLTLARLRPVPADRARRAADRSLPPALDPTADEYRILAWHLTSSWPRDGLITLTGDNASLAAVVAANLAAVFSVDARSTLLVDTHFRDDAIRGVLGLPRSPGLAAVLENRRKWSESLLTVPVGRSRTMSVLPSGLREREVGNAEGQAIVSDLRRAAQRHDATVVTSSLPQALRMRAGDDVVVCAERGVTRLATLGRAVASLIDAGARVRGIVVWEGSLPAAPRT
jgi:hypothetical protein